MCCQIYRTVCVPIVSSKPLLTFSRFQLSLELKAGSWQTRIWDTEGAHFAVFVLEKHVHIGAASLDVNIWLPLILLLMRFGDKIIMRMSTSLVMGCIWSGREDSRMGRARPSSAKMPCSSWRPTWRAMTSPSMHCSSARTCRNRAGDDWQRTWVSGLLYHSGQLFFLPSSF